MKIKSPIKVLKKILPDSQICFWDTVCAPEFLDINIVEIGSTYSRYWIKSLSFCLNTHWPILISILYKNKDPNNDLFVVN